MKPPYEVTIIPADDGSYIVRVGCKALTFASRAKLFDALGDYLAAPDETIKRYYEEHGWDTAPPPPPIANVYSAPATIGRGV